MKILHTADIHLGAKFKGARRPQPLRRQLEATFTGIIDLAISENIDLLIIAGDLFDSSGPPLRLVEFVRSQFLRLNNARICLVPGTHEGQLYRDLWHEDEIPNLTVFLAPEWGYKEYPEINTTVYGINPEERHPLKRLVSRTTSSHQVAVLHAGYLIPGKTGDDIVVTGEEIRDCGMNYVALGHWHSTYDCSQGTVAARYPGAPEPIAISELGAGNVIILDGMNPRICRVGMTRCEELEIDIAGFTGLTGLKKRVSAGADQALRRKVKLKGVSSLTLGLDVKQLEEELAPGFSQLQIADNSVIPKEKLEPDTYAHQPFIKRFLELMRDEIDSRPEKDRAIAEQALHYGLALLEGKEVL